MFQWITIALAVVAAGALLVGADQVVKYFQSRDVPVENQLSPSPTVVPSPGTLPSPSPTAAASGAAAQSFDSRFPGSTTGATPGTTPTPIPTGVGGTAVDFNAPTVAGESSAGTSATGTSGTGTSGTGTSDTAIDPVSGSPEPTPEPKTALW
jgi:hypothetical protein